MLNLADYKIVATLVYIVRMVGQPNKLCASAFTYGVDWLTIRPVLGHFLFGPL